MSFPSLTLGGLDLTDYSGLQYGISLIAEGTSKGSPVPIELAVKSWLQNGSIVVTQGYDNRTVSLRVRLQGPDLVQLAEAEAALFSELGKPNLLTWTPGGDFGPPTVFKVVTSSMDVDDSAPADIAESRVYPFRTYNLQLLCEAFTRSATETITAALPASGTTTTSVDACSSATGWSGTVDGATVAPTVRASTTVGVSTTVTSPTKDATALVLSKTFAADTTTKKYLLLDVKAPTGAGGGRFSAGVGTSHLMSLPLIYEGPAPTAGFTRLGFQLTADSLGGLSLQWSGVLPEGVSSLVVDQVSVSDEKPHTGTLRQQARSLLVGGSAPSPGTLVVESETSSLGDVLVYVFASDETTNGYSPAMRQFRTAGAGETTDTSTVSGKRELLSSTLSFSRPVKLLPKGRYLLVARMKAAADGDFAFHVSTRTTFGAEDVKSVDQDLGSFSLGTLYSVLPLGVLQLPTTDLDVGTSASMALDFSATTGGGNVTVDEVWLFNASIGSLVQVACGTGTPVAGGSARRLWVEPPTLLCPRPRVRVGHSADKSDSYFPTVTGWDFPRFNPPQVNAHVVTTNATDAALSLRNYAGWHTNAAS